MVELYNGVFQGDHDLDSYPPCSTRAGTTTRLGTTLASFPERTGDLGLEVWVLSLKAFRNE